MAIERKVRITVTIDDDLHREANRRATDAKLTLSDVAGQALRDHLAPLQAGERR